MLIAFNAVFLSDANIDLGRLFYVVYCCPRDYYFNIVYRMRVKEGVIYDMW